uniref:Nuclease HARBI1 n=1 Tax=Cacopsylla melanoneura TaxID=428564 RepID=A0A8D9EB45_9HEMI
MSHCVCMKFEEGRINGYLLGDAGYMQTLYLFTPLRDPTTPSQIRYNYAHKKTRCTIERLFGIWKKRFPCLSRKLLNKLANAQTIIAACAVLHNIGRHDNINYFNENIIVDDEENHVERDVTPRRILAFRNAFIIRHFR